MTTRLTERQAETLALVRKHQPISRSDVAQRLGCSNMTATQHLHALCKVGLIAPSGIGKYSRWMAVQIKQNAPRNPIEQAASVWEYASRLGVMV